MDFKKYLVKMDGGDLLSSLKALDKKIVKQEMVDWDLDSIEELKDHILEQFEFCLQASKDDMLTIMYFQKLINHEKSSFFSVYQDDIEALWAFVYETNEGYSYYLPTEIREIIKRELNI